MMHGESNYLQYPTLPITVSLQEKKYLNDSSKKRNGAHWGLLDPLSKDGNAHSENTFWSVKQLVILANDKEKSLTL